MPDFDHVDSIGIVFQNELKNNTLTQEMVTRVHRFFNRADLYSVDEDDRVFNSKAHSVLTVSMIPSEFLPEGNLQKDIPNIRIIPVNPNGAVLPEDSTIKLTWEEARKLCAALWITTNIAEFG